MRRRWLVFAIACIACLALVASLRPVRSFVHAVALTCQFAGIRPIPIRIYWRLKERKIDEVVGFIPGPNEQIQITSFSPVGVANPPAVVVIHGFSPEGMRESAIRGIGHNLAVDGFQVIVPNLPVLQQMQITPKALYEIGAAVQWAHEKTGRSVALIGVSFGGGLALRVASMPQFSHDLGTVFVLGAYNSVPRLCDYFTGRGAVAPDGSIDRREPSGLGFPVMALQHLNEEVPAEDVASIAELTRQLVIAKSFTPEFNRLMATYPERVQKSFIDLITVTPTQDARFQAIFAKHHAVYEEVSAHNHMAGVSAEVLLLHGRDDVLIPPEEALWNEAELKAAHKNVHLTMTPWVSHRAFNGTTSLSEKLAFINCIAQLLTALHTNS